MSIDLFKVHDCNKTVKVQLYWFPRDENGTDFTFFCFQCHVHNISWNLSANRNLASLMYSMPLSVSVNIYVSRSRTSSCTNPSEILNAGPEHCSTATNITAALYNFYSCFYLFGWKQKIGPQWFDSTTPHPTGHVTKESILWRSGGVADFLEETAAAP